VSILDALAIRKRLGRDDWGAPEPFGPDGWQFDSIITRWGRIIVTADSPKPEFRGWIHASISRRAELPTYGDLVHLH